MFLTTPATTAAAAACLKHTEEVEEAEESPRARGKVMIGSERGQARKPTKRRSVHTLCRSDGYLYFEFQDAYLLRLIESPPPILKNRCFGEGRGWGNAGGHTVRYRVSPGYSLGST